MKIIIIVFSLSFLVVIPFALQAQSDIKWSGFAFWVHEIPDSGSTNFKLKHAWLIADKQLGDSLELRAFLAFQGPPRIVHTLYLKWRNPLPFVEYMRVGKFEPPFGHGINFYRADRNPTIIYSSIDAPVAARSHGVEITNSWNSLKFQIAAMSGERLLGNIGPEYESKWDTYMRLKTQVIEGISIGTSLRYGPVPAQGVDLQLGSRAVCSEIEVIQSRDTTNLSVLNMVEVMPWLTAVVRYEYLEGAGNVWTSGLRIKLPANCELKANFIDKKSKESVFLTQIIVRW